MCQLIVKPAGVEISKHILHEAWNSNNDGGGFAFRNEKHEVLITKGYFKFKSFWKAYKQIAQHDVLIHFRLATHGTKTLENCHPFIVTHQAVIAHNGILYQFQPLGADMRSDTRIFVETVLTPAIEKDKLNVDDFFSSPAAKSLLEHFTKGNKFAALTQKGFYIFNEAQGEWKDKVWYSAGYPLDNKWDYCYDWRDWVDKKWGLDRWNANNAKAGSTLTLIDNKTVLDMGSMDRCDMCDELVPKTYQMSGENICNACWSAFRGV